MALRAPFVSYSCNWISVQLWSLAEIRHGSVVKARVSRYQQAAHRSGLTLKSTTHHRKITLVQRGGACMDHGQIHEITCKIFNFYFFEGTGALSLLECGQRFHSLSDGQVEPESFHLPLVNSRGARLGGWTTTTPVQWVQWVRRCNSRSNRRGREIF